MVNEQQNSIIIGLLLGDGHLSKKGRAKNASLIVKRSKKDKRYSQYHVQLFDSLITDSGLIFRSTWDNRTGKRYHYCEFSLKADTHLTTHYEKWYLDKIKIIPRDLQLNAEIISTWFCDDGWIIKSKNNYFQIGLATDGFSEEDVFFLQEILSKRYSERIGIYKRKNGNYYLQLADYAARKMIKEIDLVFPEGMERKRKWKGIEFGKSHYSIAKSSEERRVKVDNFVNSHNEFYLIDLAKHLEWSFTRNNGVVEWDTQNTKRYLKYYIDNNILIEEPRSEYRVGIKYRKQAAVRSS